MYLGKFSAVLQPCFLKDFLNYYLLFFIQLKPKFSLMNSVNQWANREASLDYCN